jgi:hypothetical protein
MSLGTDVQIACDSFSWIDGNTYTTNNNTATYTLTNTAGCDSVAILDLTINSSTSSIDIITACDSYIWIDGNNYLSNNNTATFLLTNTAGCDSIVFLDLTIETVDVSVISNDTTLTANNSFATYQWIDCENNNATITDETSQSYTPTENGIYAVVITSTLNSCVDTSDCVIISTIGVNELFTDKNIKIYPNPNNGAFTLQNNTHEPLDISVFDAMGKVVFQGVALSSTQTKLNLNVPPGVYMVNLQQNGTMVTKKMVVR